MGKSVLFIGILLSIVIRGFFIVNGLDVADVSKLHQPAEIILKGGNPYVMFNYAIYPPICYYIAAIVLFFSNLLHIPFHILTKILPNLSDIIITLVLYRFLINRNIKSIKTVLWCLIFVLNPISIIISSAHGQFDSIISLLVLLAIYILTFNPAKFNKFTPALLLGLAIAIKPNPAMLLPFFILYKRQKLKENVIFLCISLAPAIISISPYMWLSPNAVITNIFSYSGIYDFSYAAILRGLWYQQNAQIWLPLAGQILEISKLTFIFGAVLLLLIFGRSKTLFKSCLVLYLLFIGVYFGISAQYLSWILPLAVLAQERMILPFSISGTIALLGFYLFFGPEILFGRFWHGAAFQSKYMLIYFAGNLMLWITTLMWLIKIVKGQAYTVFKTFSPLHKRVVIGFLIMFIMSLIPILLLIINTLALIEY